MNIMTVQEWIERVGYIDKEVAILQSELDRCLTAFTDVCDAASISAATTNYAKNIKNRIEKLLKTKRSIVDVISLVENETLRQSLALRYIRCMTWESVAEEMSYDLRSVYRLHKKALAEAAKIIKERTCKK